MVNEEEVGIEEFETEDQGETDEDIAVEEEDEGVSTDADSGVGGDESDADAGNTGSGGGTISPHESAIGTQPSPVGTAEGGAPPASEFRSPEFASVVPSAEVPTAEENFGVAHLVNYLSDEDLRALVEKHPELTHQGQAGSGVAPGAALPGESVAERNRRSLERRMGSELRRMLENNQLGNKVGRVEIGEEGGFDIIFAGGVEGAQIRMSDLLRGSNGRIIRLSDITLLGGGL